MEMDAFIVDLIEVLSSDDDSVDRYHGPIRPLRSYDRHNPLELLSNDQQFIEYYRFPRRKIMDIVDLVAEEIEHPTRRSCSINAALQVCLALKFYAFGSYLKDLCEIYGVEKATASRCISRVTNALCKRSGQFIYLPRAIEHSTEIKRKFAAIDPALPNVIGAIDGTHIRLTLLRKEEEALYVNRKMFHSINVQVVADADLMFQNVVARFPGKTHDSYVLRKSTLFDTFESGHMTGYLLGDSAYPLRAWLLTPVPLERTEADIRYNITHRKLRNVVERTIGVCKARFRCIDNANALKFRPKKCCKVIVAVCVLHNIARKANLPFEEPSALNEELELNPLANEHSIGREARDRVIDRYFS